MDVNQASGLNSGSGRQADRPGILIKRRSSLRFVEPEFEPNFEWMDTPGAHALVAELPGFKNEDVKVQLDNQGNLIISGERFVEEMILVEGNWRPRKRPGFKFRKVFSIPENVNTTNIATRFENELFHITINKLRPSIEIKSSDILDQEKKSIPQVGESSARFTEESKEKKDDKASSGKPEQNLRDEKVETSEVAKSSATQVDNVPSNKLVQNNRGEKDETLEAVKFSATQDDKAVSNKNDQIPRDDKAETSRVSKPSTTQDDKALSNKSDQSERDEKAEILGISNSSTTQDNKALSNKPDQSPRDEKVETLQVAKSIVVQDEQASSNQPNQSQIDKKVEIPKVAETSAIQQDDEKVKTPKATKSNTTQDTIKMGTKLEASNKIEELPKRPSLLAKGNLVDSNTQPEQFELVDFDQEEIQMSVGDQFKDKLIENTSIKSNPSHEDLVQETRVSSSKVKKEGKGEEDKQTILKVCPYVSQFILSRRELVAVGAIVIFSITLYITYTLKYP
ncbi:hypothetical protein SUGI_1196360 [Cryptomeria japonica]|uniref:uncharacterized protein LOC131050668 n=1 Tax=Cryptomeria japonica TaxID=3369 RepID=UPI0024148A6A|nr:uncharacterized protein LOC131050668 [Cryptomeria japonica]GLJ55692.1 hypothetical protein SUGI_1196360 [Cryptomeria japonica]